MARPDGGLIQETNEQYYAGAQGFISATPAANEQTFTGTFNTDLSLGGTNSWNPTDTNYALNNFKLYTSADDVTYAEYILPFEVLDNVVKIIMVVILIHL